MRHKFEKDFISHFSKKRVMRVTRIMRTRDMLFSPVIVHLTFSSITSWLSMRIQTRTTLHLVCFDWCLQAVTRISVVFIIGLDKSGYQVNSFLISRRKHMLWVLIRSASARNEKNIATFGLKKVPYQELCSYFPILYKFLMHFGTFLMLLSTQNKLFKINNKSKTSLHLLISFYRTINHTNFSVGFFQFGTWYFAIKCKLLGVPSWKLGNFA